MTTQAADIESLSDRIQKEFPAGCDGIVCEDCPLNDKNGIVKTTVCDMMWRIAQNYNEN